MALLAPGLALFAVGFVVLFVLLVLEGAMAKSLQLAAVGRLASGKAGGGRRIAFFLALLGLGAGTCTTFAGVAASDSARAKACEEICRERGYDTGRIRGSTERDPKQPKRHAFVACACEGGATPDPLELDAKTLTL